ncbi:MAG: hypothetical protein ABIZ04_23390 [Opitutus sp.]
MPTSFLRRSFRLMTSTRTVLVACCFAAGAGAAFGAKTYTLFEGNNIAVGQGKDVYPVRDVNGGSWVVMIDGKEVLVSGKSGPINMKVTPLQKLADVSVSFANLQTERAYTFNNDPTVRMTRSMGKAAQLAAGYEAAASQAAAAQTSAPTVSSAIPTGTPAGVGSAPSASGVANQAAFTASKNAGADLVRHGANDVEGNFDALDVSFEISSATPLAAPYIVTTTRIHEVDSPEGSFRNVVSARALEPVTAKPTKVKYQQPNFPFGYQLEGFGIHVYDGGREVASTVAPKRQVFTMDQAFEYVRNKYLETHKTGTAPATPVMGDLPPDLAAQVATGRYAAPVYVKVSTQGLAEDAYADAAGKTKINDAFVQSVIHGIRFQPALEAGKPVEGMVALNLSKLRM